MNAYTRVLFLVPFILVGSLPIAWAQLPPIESVGGVSLPGVPSSVTRDASRINQVAHDNSTGLNVNSGTSDETEGNVAITVSPGATELIRIASGYLNRIITPFENP